MKTINADTGTVEGAATPASQPIPQMGNLLSPSLFGNSTINIPMKVAVPIIWIAVGFGLCWYFTRPSRLRF